MTLLDSILQTLSMSILVNPYVVFLVAFIAIGFWGDASLITLSILAVNLNFSFSLMLFGAYLGVMAGDTVWFFIGTKLIKRIKKNRKIKIHYKRIAYIIEKVFQNRFFLALIVVKFLYGTRLITTIYLSDERLAFKKFFQYDLVANLLWLGVVSGIGYLIGLGFLMLRTFKNVQLAISSLVLICLLIYAARVILDKKIEKKKA